jgi:hypothetical protein
MSNYYENPNFSLDFHIEGCRALRYEQLFNKANNLIEKEGSQMLNVKYVLVLIFTAQILWAADDKKSTSKGTTKPAVSTKSKVDSKPVVIPEVQANVKTETSDQKNAELDAAAKVEEITEDNNATKSTDKEGTSSIQEKAPAKKEKGEGGRSFGRIGLSYGISFPHFTEYGLDYLTLNKFFSFSGILGGAKAKMGGGVSTEISSQDLRVRWHPFASSFFFGVGYGIQTIGLQATTTSNSTTAVTKLKIKGNYMLPHIGWFRVWDIGLTMGFDLGYLRPSGVTSTLDTDTPGATQAERDALLASTEYQKSKKDIEAAGKLLGSVSIPYLTLFKIGWVF